MSERENNEDKNDKNEDEKIIECDSCEKKIAVLRAVKKKPVETTLLPFELCVLKGGSGFSPHSRVLTRFKMQICPSRSVCAATIAVTVTMWNTVPIIT